MALRNTSSEFGSLAKWLHWLVAIGIFWLIYLGLEQSGMERGPAREELRAFHGSVALVVFALMTVRLVWRLTNKVPAHPDGFPAWQRITATLVHWGLYVAVFVQLFSGPMTVATGGNPVPFFGLFSISLPIAENRELHEILEEVHEFAWKIVAALLILHVLAALYNHFVAKNDVLRRMTVGIKKEG
ncbi:MAG: cytochrome b [Gammaproteobacteria bacterium]|nr:cytochrome b [Gammaproteobacteria bacterium]MDH3372419.1 cytochrome b [Gammaproteobacteria bacterium]MDH3409130.1 cytochrome b [Gammaproteobacteria bacterium]MDH3551161.1 cytochrome b [Gammaproteobacteria bacterium]